MDLIQIAFTYVPLGENWGDGEEAFVEEGSPGQNEGAEGRRRVLRACRNRPEQSLFVASRQRRTGDKMTCGRQNADCRKLVGKEETDSDLYNSKRKIY